MTVDVRMMTLYGIEKSGVGSGRRRFVVLVSLSSRSLIYAIAAGTSKPRLASGGYSAYRRMVLSNAIVKSIEAYAGTRISSSIVCGRDLSLPEV